MSIYTGKIFTFDAYRHFFMYGTGNLTQKRTAYDASVQAYMDAPDPDQVKSSGFPIMRIRRVIDPSTIQ